MQALRTEFGSNNLVTAAITADGTSGGKIDAADYAGAAQYVDWYNVMTYDFFGAFDADGPTAPHSPLTSYAGIPTRGFNSADAIAKLRRRASPRQAAPRHRLLRPRLDGRHPGRPRRHGHRPGPGTYEQGIEDYKVLKTSCPVTGTIAGTAYAHCGSNWWSYDTPRRSPAR